MARGTEFPLHWTVVQPIAQEGLGKMARIVVIDDDVVTLTTVAAMLRKLGHEVVAANNVAEGIRAFEKHGADVVMTDIFMPYVDGLEALKSLKRMAPRVKVVCMSGGPVSFADPEAARDSILNVAKVWGADASIVKPIELDRLDTLLNDILRGTVECARSIANDNDDTTADRN